MPNIFHQSVEDILKAATPEQRILWNDVFLRFGERCSISQYVYFGSIAGAVELTTYVARKIFLAYEFSAGYTNSLALTPGGIITLHNEVGGAYFYGGENSAVWDATAATLRYTINKLELKNKYFSRFTTSQYNTCTFIGYRIVY